MYAQLLRCGQLFVTPRTVACQSPLSREFSRQEYWSYWSGLTFPPPGDLPDPGIKLTFLASPALAGGFFTTLPPGKPILYDTPIYSYIFIYICVHIYVYICTCQVTCLWSQVLSGSSVQSLSHVRLLATPWTAACQASLSITNSWGLAQTHVYRVSDTIQPSHPVSSPSLPALNLSQHQGSSQ